MESRRNGFTTLFIRSCFELAVIDMRFSALLGLKRVVHFTSFSLCGKPNLKTDNEDECAKTVHKEEPYRGVNLRYDL